MDCRAGSQPPDRCRVRVDASGDASVGYWNAFRRNRSGRRGNSGLFCSCRHGGRAALGRREDAPGCGPFSGSSGAPMTDGLGQFGADLVHEGLDVLWYRGLSFPLVELIETALLALQNMAMNAVGRGVGIGRLQRTDQVQMIAVDLLQYGDIVASPAGRENADQLPDSGEGLETALVPRELHDVGVKRKIGHLETLHLFFV